MEVSRVLGNNVDPQEVHDVAAACDGGRSDAHLATTLGIDDLQRIRTQAARCCPVSSLPKVGLAFVVNSQVCSFVRLFRLLLP